LHHLEIKDQIEQTMLSKGFELIKEVPVKICDFAVRHPKFGLNGFFKLFTVGKDFIEHWIETQEEVKENLDLHANILNRHNTYLVFVLPIEELPPIKDVQSIISDENVCRKLITPIEKGNIQKSLSRLPFYPFEIPELPERVMPKNVIEALADSYFPVELISDLAGRVSERTILRKIKDNFYKDETLKFQKIPEDTSPEGYPIYSTRVKKISINNFRGIGKKLDLDTDADIIVLYGSNGTGKTSIIDAVEWSVTGEVERLWGRNYDKPINENESLVNLFSELRLAEVQIEFSKNSESIIAKRYIDLSESRRSYAGIDNRTVNDKAMIKEVVGVPIPEVDVRRLRRVFLRSHFLGQNTILEFISQNPDARYDAFSHMVGTQDYILFSKKIDSVMRILEKDLEVISEKKNVLKKVIMDLSVQLNMKKQAIEKLKKGIKEEVSIRKLVNQIRLLIQELNIEVPEFLFPKKESPEIEKIDKMVDIVSTYPPMSSNKINAINNLLIEAGSEEQRAKEKEKLRSNMEAVVTDINKLQKLYYNTQSILQSLQRELEEYLRQKEKYDKEIVNIKWATDILPKYRRTQEALAEGRKYIKALSKEKDSIQIKVKGCREKLSEISKNLEKGQKEIGNIYEPLGYLSQIKADLEAQKQNLGKMSQIAESIKHLKKETKQFQERKSELEKELEHTTGKARTIDSELDTEKQKQNRKLQLITKLKQYLDSPECPVCGHNWEKVENLTEQVEKRLSHLSSMLDELRHYVVGHDVKHLKPTLKSLMDLASEHEQLLKKETQIRSQIKKVAGDIELSVTKVKELENEKVQLDKGFDDWRKMIKYLKNKHPELEIEIIPDQIQVSTLLQSYQSKLDGLKVSHEEEKNKVSALHKEIKTLENAQKDVEDQTILHQKKENHYVGILEQINKETTERGVTNLMTEDVSILRISIENQLSKEEATKKEIDMRRSQYEKIKTELLDIEKKLNSLREKNRLFEQNFKKLKNASEAFKTNLLREGFLPDKKLSEIINEIKVKQDNEIKYFRQCELLHSLCKQWKSMVTFSQSKYGLDSMEEEKREKDKVFDVIATDGKNLSKWADILMKLKELADARRKEQERSHFKMYSPAANLVYSRLNAHPLFNQIVLEVGTNELKILAQSSKRESLAFHDISQISPRQFFSEAQLNIAALSIFLATALHQKWSGFNTILIDDPVQNMDDFNVYAFLDLIRGLIMNGHQFILTTCNRDLYKLMLVKFRDLNRANFNLFKAYRLRGVYPEGPELIRDC